jgi:signal peptidase II
VDLDLPRRPDASPVPEAEPLPVNAAPELDGARSATLPPQSWSERVLSYRLLWALAVVIFTLDQLTKTWIATRLAYPTYWPHEGAITVIDGFFYLVHVGNTGAAWSLFSGQSTLLALLAGFTLVGIFFWRRQLGLRDRRTQLAFGLLCGGIVGNCFDRVLHGHVIDFLDFHFGTYIYPTFNLADAGICVGVVLYLWQSFQEPAR